MLKTKLFEYLQTTSIARMTAQAVILIVVATIVAFLWVVSLNFDYIKDNFIMFHNNTITTQQLEEDIEQSIRINVILERTLDKIPGAARAYLFKFHNGQIGINGISFIFQSLTHEAARPGVKSKLNQFQQVPISINPEKIRKYINDECYYFKTNPIDVSDSFNSILVAEGIKEIYTCPVYDLNSNLIGFIGVDFLYITDNTDLVVEDIYNILRLSSSQLVPALRKGN